jgi:(1->4)-alpha-D-glucan 1-alpha-D-glucosylmutase
VRSHDAIVGQLAELVGVAPFFRTASGVEIETSFETKRSIVEAFGLQIATAALARRALDLLQSRRKSLSPYLVVAQDESLKVLLPGVSEGQVEFVLTDEAGTARAGRTPGTSGPRGIVAELPALSSGYWKLRIAWGRECAESLVICAPKRCYEPEAIRRGEKVWGVTAQLYSLRSDANFGIGDYGDLAILADRAGALGASFLGPSPVHALFTADLTKISPYSPSSRLLLDTQHVTPLKIKGFAESSAGEILNAPATQAHIASLRQATLVDRRASWEEKRPVLDAVWSHFIGGKSDPAFASFRTEAGDALTRHAVFEVLSERFVAEGAKWSEEWPGDYRNVASEAVRCFAAANASLIDFHAWLQWQADLQLAEAQASALASGMSIGLFRDLAVGVDRAGSEIWAAPHRFATVLSIGAPPDPFSAEGQNWRLAPPNPLSMEDDRLLAVRQILAANMRHAGAIRIDHAFQLQRLFLIPDGMAASSGAYVTYPFEALLAVLRLESALARCMVIAEDLGNGPDGFSDTIMAAGVYSCRVLQFEREGDGAFRAPEAYPERALAVLTTHDLPTFRGWWRGLDIDLRHASGQYSTEDAEQEHANRARDRERLSGALASQGIQPAGPPPVDPPLEAATSYLARSRSLLAAIQLEDAAGELNQANLPGPDLGHPNWQRKLSQDISELTATGRSLARIGALFANEGRGLELRIATALAGPPPRATYRLQFHKDFTFDAAAAVVPYLKQLGISHVYASPLQKARPGSVHGYDIVDHAVINPELGGEAGFVRLSEALQAHGLGLVLDIVPNHMGIGGADNDWWLSVLEWGQLSPHAIAFDIDWERLGANGKLVLPFLGERYGNALDSGQLKLTFDQEGSLSIWHFEHRFPINPLTYPVVLDRMLTLTADPTEVGFREILAISARLRTLAENGNGTSQAGVLVECEGLKQRLAAAFAVSPALPEAANRTIQLINGVTGIPESFDTLHRILEMQTYRLAYWRVAASDINYRRFFDINTLAGIRIEEPSVFQRTHAMIFNLVRTGRVQGLRIDHVDGLADPEAYIRALQSEIGPGFYILVEKILGQDEELRAWPMSGTTGYDALNLIDGVLVDCRAARSIEDAYREASGTSDGYEILLRQAKRETLDTSFASELEVIVSDLARIARADRRTRDYTVHAMREALAEIIERFPVYRSYIADEPAPEDRSLIERTVAEVIKATRMPDSTLHEFIAKALLGDIDTSAAGRPLLEHIGRFRRRFQQLTGPVTAKSSEDTLFYRYGPLLALNEVGGEPSHIGVSPEAFHAANAERRRSWPHAMIATATHDTKRGEDGRARLLALTELPERWTQYARVWQSLSQELMPDPALPDGADRHLILQQLLAAWPLSLLDQDCSNQLNAFRERMEGWVEKALREAKRHTSWTNPQEPYETAAKALVARSLEPGSRFLERFRPLALDLAQRGMVKGLTRTVLKLTLPGVPDFYQGTEFWDLSMVDPDNRRPVDFAAREQTLKDDAPADELLRSWRDGRIKQHVIASLLKDRLRSPRLYEAGDYRQIAVEGATNRDLLAFARSRGSEILLVLATRLTGNAEGWAVPIGDRWSGIKAAATPGRWRDVLTGRELTIDGQGCVVSFALQVLPVAVLRQQ